MEFTKKQFEELLNKNSPDEYDGLWYFNYRNHFISAKNRKYGTCIRNNNLSQFDYLRYEFNGDLKRIVVKRDIYKLLYTLNTVNLSTGPVDDRVSRAYGLSIRSRASTWRGKDSYICYNVKDFAKFSFFKFNDEGKLTATDTKATPMPYHLKTFKWDDTSRVNIKVSKLFNALEWTVYNKKSGATIVCKKLKAKILNRALELLTDEIKAFCLTTDDFKVSNETKKIYGKETYEKSGGLIKSCMRPESTHGCNKHAKFYDAIGVKTIYHETDEKLSVRALLFENCTDVNTGKNITFVDRPYCTPIAEKVIIRYAKEKGYAYRTVNDPTIVLDGRAIRLDFPVTKESIEFLSGNGAPYLDTLCNLDVKRKILTNGNINNGRRLRNASGDFVPIVYCSVCEDDCNGRTVVKNGTVYCKTCIKKEHTRCDYCGEYNEKDTVRKIDGNRVCERCVDAKTILICKDCGEEHFEGKPVDGESVCYTNGCAREYYNCHSCNRVHRRNDMIMSERYGAYCTDCAEDAIPKCVDCNDMLLNNTYRAGNSDGRICGECHRVRLEARQADNAPTSIPETPSITVDTTAEPGLSEAFSMSLPFVNEESISDDSNEAF